MGIYFLSLSRVVISLVVRTTVHLQSWGKAVNVIVVPSTAPHGDID